jgi:hypothetical protein
MESLRQPETFARHESSNAIALALDAHFRDKSTLDAPIGECATNDIFLNQDSPASGSGFGGLQTVVVLL